MGTAGEVPWWGWQGLNEGGLWVWNETSDFALSLSSHVSEGGVLMLLAWIINDSRASPMGCHEGYRYGAPR